MIIETILTLFLENILYNDLIKHEVMIWQRE
jgi:hypothetical protein